VQLIIDAASYQQVQELQESTSYPGLMTQVGNQGEKISHSKISLQQKQQQFMG